MDPERRRKMKHGSFQIVAGGSAGCVEVSLMHPLDLVKTRFQLQTAPNSATTSIHHHHYKGIGDCVSQMYRHEGVASFWKGILPPILVETPKRAWKFFTFEQFKLLFGASTPTTYALAGLGSGLTEAIIVNPFEVVKVKMQSCRNLQTLPAFHVAKEIVKEEGLRRGIVLKGLTATMGRNGCFNMVYFGLYNSVKDLVPTFSDPRAEFGRRFLIGLAAGTLASMLNIPFDVAKSRIQGPQPEANKYQSTFRTIGKIYKEEGVLALYKGLVPKIMRLGPGGAIMMIVYENVFGFLKNTYPD